MYSQAPSRRGFVSHCWKNRRSSTTKMQGLLRPAAHVTVRSITKGNATMDNAPPDLGDLERDVMQLIWAGGPMTAEAVRERLGRPLKESTVRTVLRRLEEKGFVSHTVEQRT